MVSLWFPKMFPREVTIFLNLVQKIVPRKQETFGVSSPLTLGIQGFLGWKPVPTQETQIFLHGFLVGMATWP